jgi:L-lactate dehydrogenase complex protein LldG
MTKARQNILDRIEALNLATHPLPEIPEFKTEKDLRAAFELSIQMNKGIIVNEAEVDTFLASFSTDRIFSTEKSYKEQSKYKLPRDARDLDNLEVAIISADFGIAENGAIWIPDLLLPFRVIPFITQHLIVLLSANDIVGNMHDAYQRIGSQSVSFGLLMAGPSKTADIEQSLVVGAHGAKSLRVTIR